MRDASVSLTGRLQRELAKSGGQTHRKKIMSFKTPQNGFCVDDKSEQLAVFNQTVANLLCEHRYADECHLRANNKKAT